MKWQWIERQLIRSNLLLSEFGWIFMRHRSQLQLDFKTKVQNVVIRNRNIDIVRRKAMDIFRLMKLKSIFRINVISEWVVPVNENVD